MTRRRFIDAPDARRCKWTTKSGVQCGRAWVGTGAPLCAQHARMSETFCDHCGGNDEMPPEHTQDCARPATPEPTP